MVHISIKQNDVERSCPSRSRFQERAGGWEGERGHFAGQPTGRIECWRKSIILK